jgi:hypothetical protein
VVKIKIDYSLLLLLLLFNSVSPKLLREIKNYKVHDKMIKYKNMDTFPKNSKSYD